MEENLASSMSSLSLSPQSCLSQSPVTHHQTPNKENFAPQTPPPSVTRLWRPAAQRNVRNQWSKLASYRKEWSSSSSFARSHATDLTNSYLSQRYMKSMELGVLSDMPNIKKKACWKLFKQQELCRNKLLSSYKNMVAAVVNMVNSGRSMRTFLKATSSSLVQFSNVSEDKNDSGDCGGIPVFTFFSISSLEELSCELIQMFTMELSLKRLLVLEFLSLSSEEFPVDPMNWPDELYPGEFSDLTICDLYSGDTCEPIHPKTKAMDSNYSYGTAQCQLDQEVLQGFLVMAQVLMQNYMLYFLGFYFTVIVGLGFLKWKQIFLFCFTGLLVYITTWLVEVNIDTSRLDEIFAIVGEEIRVSFS